ncbi:hypothetical protein Hdeb2414_s0070g00772271 [Helianthus debilis subsp. tardiflorus]
MFQSFGPSSFFLSVFKSFVHQNCLISKITPDEDVIVMADEFWRQFYGKKFKVEEENKEVEVDVLKDEIEIQVDL